MSTSSDYIIITESHDTNDGTEVDTKKIIPEEEGISIMTLENQGISIIDETLRPATTEPRDQFTQELMDEAGIEILSSDEDL
ncbi:MAG: hypothetical protein WAZ40_02230 [Minisyncoccia bacterium]|jgi:hypothetical protein